MPNRRQKMRLRLAVSAFSLVGLLYGTLACAQGLSDVAEAIRPLTPPTARMEAAAGSLLPEAENDSAPMTADASTPAAIEETLPTTPTPNPTPAPIAYKAPFSLSDCMDLLDLAIDELPVTAEEQKPYNQESMLHMLEAISDYLKGRDDLHSTLIGYKWDRIARVPITTGLIDDKSFIWSGRDIPKNVTALSFEVERGDVYLHNLEVYDENDELVAPFAKDQQVILRHSIPRRYVFHLYLPTNIKSIKMACSQVNPADNRTPQLSIHAGRTRQAEHGKAAIHYIWKAELDIAAQNPSQARMKLMLSQDEIREYRRALRLYD